MSEPNDSRYQETIAPPPRTAAPTVVSPPPDPQETLVPPPEPASEMPTAGSSTQVRTGPRPAEPVMPGGPPSFQLLRELGRGDMGVVYKARQTALNRIVALKMVLGGGHASQEELDRFRNEAAAIARLSHPAIVQIYETGEHDGMPFFAMEYCPGGSLSSHTSGHPLHPGRAAMETVRMVIEREPVALRLLRPDVPRDLETICLKCLQKDKRQRYITARDLADDLNRFLQGQPILARPVGVFERAVRWARRKPGLAALSAALALTLVGAVVGWARFTVELGEQRNAAQKSAEEARENFHLAEKRFQEAMGVVDRYFTEVSESTLLNEAGLEPLRQALLRNAQEFYGKFVQARDGDESL